MNRPFLDDACVHDMFDVSTLPIPIRHAYNPALFEHDGKRWAFVRTGAFRASATHLLRVDGERLEYVRRVEPRLPWWRSGDTIEDIRFFVHNGEPYISHTYSKTSRVAGWFRPEIRKIFLLKLLRNHAAARKFDLDKCCMGYSALDHALNIKSMSRFDDFPNKNWQFFSSKGSLFTVHSIEPEHKVIQVEGNRIVAEWKTPMPSIYDATFGRLRGGTPPVLFDGKYWSFFHSTVRDASGTYYLGGLYTFESAPPFRILEMTKAPIMLPPDNVTDLEYVPTQEIRNYYVVYPMGAVREQASIRLSYGINDTRMAQKLYRFQDLQKVLVMAVLPGEAASEHARRFP